MLYKMNVKKLEEEAVLPKRATVGSAGVDLCACIPININGENFITIKPGEIKTIGTGIAISITAKGCPHEDMWASFIYARSGIATKYGVCPVNCVGVIDSDYRGEVKVALINHGKEDFVVKHSMRIAQLVVTPVLLPEICEVEELDSTIRGTGGFGSTGVD